MCELDEGYQKEMVRHLQASYSKQPLPPLGLKVEGKAEV